MEKAPTIRACRHHYQPTIGGKNKDPFKYWKANMDFYKSTRIKFNGLLPYYVIRIKDHRGYVTKICLIYPTRKYN